MEFNKSRIYTAVNADELKVGSKVYVADSLSWLQEHVTNGNSPCTIKEILPSNCSARFRTVDSDGDIFCWCLAYLVEEPDSLKWTDLKIGDVVKCKICKIRAVTKLVTGIDESAPIDGLHILLSNEWVDDKELESWEKVEK